MIFVYSALGFAMITTVVAIFETSITINKRQFIDKLKKIDPDIKLLQYQNDRLFLSLLKELEGISLGSGKDICLNIKNGFTDKLDPNYPKISKYSILNNYNTAIPAYSIHQRLRNGCELIKDSHRIIIVPNPAELNKYNYYSCIIKIEPKCIFEIVD
tara:strand:+ start:3516 stop:3986 length:471 start_codon:yes stop_codon:yes gene_type:complete